jgi:Protein of unknown function (DUF4236)
MSLRFRKSVKIIPGVRLNLSKSGTSLSVGRRGFTTNLSKKGAKTTVGLPGTGLSYSSYKSHKRRSADLGTLGWIIVAAIAILIIMTVHNP